MKDKILLVSLVSDQTMPNIQLIKELDDATNYLFITTEKMEKVGTRKWIEQTCNINEPPFLIVNEYSFSDIEYKLSTYDFDVYEKIYVNISGGTKIMTMVSELFFKNIGANIYYVTGNKNEYIQVFPKKKNNTFYFERKITLADYLHAYGFAFKSKAPSYDLMTAKPIIDVYSSDEKIRTHIEAIMYLNKQRNKQKGVKSEDFHKVQGFLSEIKFNPQKERTLNDIEVKYLSGEWFEEYIGLSIKNELNLTDNEIFIGTNIFKEIGKDKDKNKLDLLLGEEAIKKLTEKRKKEDNNNEQKSTNEIDVMFVYNGRFYSIECKSSIIAIKTILDKDENPKEKQYNILGETIYKSDSLKNKFGLYSQTTIITLTDLYEYWNSGFDKVQQYNKAREMEELINRANLSNIKLVDRKMIRNSSSIFDLINSK